MCKIINSFKNVNLRKNMSDAIQIYRYQILSENTENETWNFYFLFFILNNLNKAQNSPSERIKTNKITKKFNV